MIEKAIAQVTRTVRDLKFEGRMGGKHRNREVERSLPCTAESQERKK
jgi:hypothetical protein